jgi:peptidoglycan/LPS O-acetylase OafA/YrhL
MIAGSHKAERRTDLDGLRGIAIALVVAYHAKVGLFPGGFVGVDVFFVISGYLITNILVGENGHVPTLAEFFERRTRRIVPALVVMAIAVSVAGFFILSSIELQQLGASLVTLSVLGSNFFFWRHIDYFAGRAPEEPLLHTWSIAVEEQFYVFLPIALLLTRAIGLRKTQLLAVMSLFAVSSLVASVAWTNAHPVAAFYLLPTRLWELLCGGMLAITPLRVGARGAQAGAAIGFTVIIAAAAFFTPSTPYPGIAAALVVAGASLVVYCARVPGNGIGILLSQAPLVWLGLVSYSVYLWHWPILTLARHGAGRELRASETSMAVAATLVIATVSWKLIESPIREHRVLISRRAWWSATAAGLGVLAVVGFALVSGAGSFSPMSTAARSYAEATADTPPQTEVCHHDYRRLVDVRGLCISAAGAAEAPRILVWGDSHANALMPVLVSLGRERGFDIVQASHSNCPPLLGARVARTPAPDHCTQFNEMVVRSVRELRVTRVVLAAYWAHYLGEDAEPKLSRLFDPYSSAGDLRGATRLRNEAAFRSALDRTVERLTAAGVEIYIVRQVPAQRGFVPGMLARLAADGQSVDGVGISRAAHETSQRGESMMFSEFDGVVEFVDPADALCATGVCVCARDGASLYIDDNHLSTHGANALRSVMAPIFHR